MCGQEQCLQEVCPVAKALESRRPTPKQRMPRQNKVMSFITYSVALAVHIECIHSYVCFGERQHVGATWDVSLHLLLCSTLQGGLEACGTVQEGGKENVDPAPYSKQPRTPRAKKVSAIFGKESKCVDADRFRLPKFDVLRTSGYLSFGFCVRL